MNNTFDRVSEAFSRQSEMFDEYEKSNRILTWMRSVTRSHLLRHLKNNDIILELNAGTGLDAVYLAQRGFRIHCIDISEGMLNKLARKAADLKLESLISYQLLSFTGLDRLDKNSFDYIFSNFGGLNCTDNLDDLFQQIGRVLRPGGKVTLVIIPPVCPWELALLFKGKFKTALRRLHKHGITANIEGIELKTYYHGYHKTVKALGNDFKIIESQGLASISPPPYMINFPVLYPRLYRWLTKTDEKLSHLFPFNRWADHFIITAIYQPQKNYIIENGNRYAGK